MNVTIGLILALMVTSAFLWYRWRNAEELTRFTIKEYVGAGMTAMAAAMAVAIIATLIARGVTA